MYSEILTATKCPLSVRNMGTSLNPSARTWHVPAATSMATPRSFIRLRPASQGIAVQSESSMHGVLMMSEICLIPHGT